MKALVGLLCGTLFGVGLALSGMTDTAKVLGFLDLFGSWVPDLAFVMGGAVMVTLFAFRFVLSGKPVLADSFDLPTSKAIDAPLLTGAVCFGVGWGIYGYCPGPAISAVAYADPQTLLFVAAMLAGMALNALLSRRA